jgi:hypothetical protein
MVPFEASVRGSSTFPGIISDIQKNSTQWFDKIPNTEILALANQQYQTDS